MARVRRELVTAVTVLSLCGCAEGRASLDAGRSARDDAFSIDAAVTFPDVWLDDAPGLDAPLPDAHVALADAHTPSPDDAFAPRPPDAFAPDASARDAGRDGGTDARVSPDASCACFPGSSCATSCGTSGTRVCTSPCAPTCAAPAEACNASDDDCDGSCDEDLVGCRAGVIRAYHDTLGGHLYTRDPAMVASGGFRVESDPFFAVYASPAPGLAPFHQCLLSGAHRLYTLDAGCEGSGALYEGVLGHVATGPVCGARPLYRLSSPDNHFYTVDAAERDYAVSIGYFDEGIAVYVW